MLRPPPTSTLFPTRRSSDLDQLACAGHRPVLAALAAVGARRCAAERAADVAAGWRQRRGGAGARAGRRAGHRLPRSEEHTSELQSRRDLVCRLLLEKKKNNI